MPDTEGKKEPPTKHSLGQPADEGGPSGKVLKHDRRHHIKKDDSGIGTERSRENSSEEEEEEETPLAGQGDSEDMEACRSLPAQVSSPPPSSEPPDEGPNENRAPDKCRVSFDEEKDEEDEEMTPATDSEDVELVEPKGPKPKHTWFLCQEILRRQYGFPTRVHDGFRLRCRSSLHMVERLELMYKMTRHNGCVNALHFNACGDRLASGSDDLSIIIWDWSISKALLVYDSGHRSNIFQAKFMPFSNDGMIVSCGRDGQVRVAEISSLGVCSNTRKLAQHKGSAHKLALHEETPKHFLSCGEDGVVFEIDIRQSKQNKLLLCEYNDMKVPLYTIHRNPMRSPEFTVGGKDHYARIYDSRFLRNSRPVRTYSPHHMRNGDYKANITCLVYNYNGTELLVSYNDEDIYLFDTNHSDGADYIHRYSGHRNNQTVKGVNFYGPKSNFVVSGSDCGYIYFWDKESEHIVQSMAGDEGGVVNVLEPHPTFPFLASSGLDDDIKIWVPSCENPPNLDGLRCRIKSNLVERAEDRKRDHNEMEAIDGQMIWFLMQHLRRTARRRANTERPRWNPPQSASSASSSSAVPPQQRMQQSSSSSSEEEDSDNDYPQSIRCTQS